MVGMRIADVQEDIDHELISKEEISDIINRAAAQASEDYRGKNPLLVCVLKGAVNTLAAFSQAMSIPVQMDFMSLSSYGSGTESSGKITVRQDLSTDVRGRHVLIVEDIIDSGITLAWLVDELKRRRAASVEIFALLEKPARRKVNVDVKYKGREIPDEFVVGFGLDYDEYYRNLDSIAVLKPSVYEGGHIALIASHGDDGMMHLPMFRRPLTRWTVNCFTGTFHGHADIVERHGDRRIRLMHGDLRAAHGRKAENHADDTIGQLFNQIDVFAFDDGHDAFGDRTIVDGVVQIVGTAGGSEVEEQRGVHHEGLGPLMLEVEHAMFARRADSRQSNLIHTSLPLPFLRSVFLLFPRLRCCDYLRFARSRVRILAPCVADGDRVAAFRHVMHAHGPHAMFRAQGADGRGGVVF